LQGAKSTSDGFSHCGGRNGEFCVAVGTVSRTAFIPVYCTMA